MSGVTKGTPLAVLAAVLAQHGELLSSGSVEADPDGAVHVTVDVPWQMQHAGAAEFYQAMLYTVGREQVRLFADRYGIDPVRLQAFLPPAPFGAEAKPVRHGDADVEMARLFAYFCRRRSDGAAAHHILGELYDQLRAYYGDI